MEGDVMNQGSSVPMMDNQYGQPIVQGQQEPGMPNNVVVNQQNPAMNLPPNLFKVNPVALNCPFCKKVITTTVTQSFNCLACVVCWCTGCLCYMCIQMCRGKDICCYDAKHTCPYCQAVVGNYTPC